ncbi:MAG: ABC transporter permease [Candidatus Limnocylindrales bacterium]
MSFLRTTGLLFRRKLLEFLRQPTWVFVGLTQPLLYLALFAPLLQSLARGPGFGSGNVLDVFVPGILVLMVFGAGMGAGWIVIWEIDSGVIERLSVTPVSRLSLVLGTVLRDVVTFVGPAVLVIAVAIPFGFHAHWAGLAVLLLLLALLTAIVSAWSAAMGILLRQIGSLAAVVTGLQLPLTLLAGILLPLSLAPAWMVLVAHVDPLYYAVQAARDLAANSLATPAVAQGFLVLGALTVVMLWGTTTVYRRALR